MRFGRRETLALGFAVLLATRLPLLLSTRCVPDGDEAVVGAMARRLLVTGEFPGYYWGQCYGLATVEAGAAAVALDAVARGAGAGVARNGVDAITLKAAVLALFAAGWFAWMSAADRILGARAAAVAGVLLVAAPAWFAFSMKAWGGLVTAFATSGAAIACLAPRSRSARVPAWVALAAGGALCAITAFAHPLTAITLAPLLLSREIRPRTVGRSIAFALPAAAVTWALAGACDPRAAHWSPSLFGTETAASPALFVGFAEAFHMLPVAASGAHFMQTPLDAPLLARVAGFLFLAAGLGAASVALFRAIRTRFFPFEAAAATAALLVVATVASMQPTALMPRYFLPAFAPLALVIAARGARGPRTAAILVGSAAALGLVAAFLMRDLPFSGWTREEERAMPVVTQALRERGITRALVTHPTLQWSLHWASGGKLAVRWIDPHDRRPEMAADVTRALSAGERVALVARAQERARIERVAAPSPTGTPRLLEFGPFLVVDSIRPEEAHALGFR